MKKLKPLILMLLFSAPACAGTLEFPVSGFTIDSLEAPPENNISQPLAMALPVQNGFAGNVNVQMQPYTLTMSDYVALSRKQFKQIGLSLLSVKEEGDVAFLEYEGSLQGRDLHWYAKAVKSGDYIYLVTATDSQKNWPSSRQKLISVVNSFKLK